MKKLFLLILLFPSTLFALDLTVMGGLGNFSFNPSRESPIGNGEMSGSLYPLGRIGISGRISDVLGFSAALQREPLLRTFMTGEISIQAGYFSIRTGPFFGLFNSAGTPLKPGVSAGMSLAFPGIFFIQLWGGGTFGAVRSEGDYSMETGRLALGFWLPHLVNTLSISGKRYSSRQTDSLVTEDELLRFCYRADIYAKNVPYTIAIDMGYQTLRRSYDDVPVSGEDVIHSVFLGFETAITASPSLVIRFGAELPVFAWGKAPLVRSESAWFFEAFAGFTWSFEQTNSLGTM